MERPQPNQLEVLKHLFRMRFDGEVIHTETDERLNVLDENFEEVEELDLSGIYEHYKSKADDRKLYYVDRVQRNLETGECLVVYMPLYDLDVARIYVRPLSGFTGTVEADGEGVSRFRYLDPEV